MSAYKFFLGTVFVAVWFCGPILCLAANQTISFYVSPKGDDTNPGTATKPFKSIPQALQAVKKTREKSTGKRYIFLRDGNHELSEPVKIEPDEGGTPKDFLMITASTGEKATIKGSRSIIGWTEFAPGIAVAEIPYSVSPKEAVAAEGDQPEQPAVEGVKWNFEQVFVNGTLAEKIMFEKPPEKAEDMQSGCWCSDFENRKIYYRLRKNETPEKLTVEVPIAKQLFIVAGNPEDERPVQNLRILDINFSLVVWETQNPENQLPALEFKYAKNCTLEKCSFELIPQPMFRFADDCIPQ